MNARSRSVRLAFVGLGPYATHLASAALRCGSITIAGGFTRTEEKRERFAQEFSCAAYPSFEAVCDDGAVDGVVLVTPNDTHCALTVKLAAAGKHVFVEKPMCNTVAEAGEMIDACTRRGVVLAVGHQDRRAGAFRHIKRMIDAGAFGRIHTFAADHSGTMMKAWPLDNWRFDTARGIGPMMHKGIHKVDTLHFLFGPTASVSGHATPLEINPEMSGTIVATLRYRSGVVGNLTCSYGYNAASLSIHGEQISVHYGGYGRTIRIKDEKTWETSEVGYDATSPEEEELAEFADAILHGRPVEVDGAAGRDAVAVARAIEEAATRGTVEKLDETLQTANT